MSQPEVKRFFADLAKDTELKSAADAKSGMSEIAAFAKSKSYDVTEDDLKTLASQGKNLNDADLEKLAAGWGISIGCVICISS